jgi:hypothetical protein
MTAPLRRFLLNHEIAVEARRIAHAATKTCHYEYAEGTDNNDEHTKNCNTLKQAIELLAMQIKLASLQRQVKHHETRPEPEQPEQPEAP